MDIDKDNAILFDGRQFVEAYGLQSDNGKFFWNHGNYSDSYPQKKDSQIIDTISNRPCVNLRLRLKTRQKLLFKEGV